MPAAARLRWSRADADGLPFPAVHEQMEQGRASLVFLHLVQLARRAAARLRNSGATDRRDDDGQGLNRDLPPGPSQYPVGRRITDDEFAHVNLKARQISWRMELHDSPRQLTQL